METVKQIVNHPLSKAVACGIIGATLLLHSHSLYAGIAFGMGLREYLFEQITNDNVDFLEEEVQDALSTRFTNVIVEELTVEGDSELQQLKIYLEYSIADTDIIDSINIDFNT